MATTTKPQRTVDVTVKSKAEEEAGWKLELDIPSFQSKFPTIVTRVPTKLADQLRPGYMYKVNLEVQKLKREGLDTSKPYNYYFGLLGLAGTPETPESKAAWDETAPPEPRQKPQSAQQGTPSPNGGREWRETYSQGREAAERERESIEAQTAAKIASGLVVHLLPMDNAESLAVIRAHFAELIMIAISAIHEAQVEHVAVRLPAAEKPDAA